MKKKLTLIASVAALGALLVVGATMAYFTSQDTATNVITTGNVKIQINEDTKASEIDNILAGTIEEDKTISFHNVTPGSYLSKIPTVENIGKNPAYIRATVTMHYKKGGVEINLPEGVEEAAVNYNSENWYMVEGDDTYYYFNGALESGKSTAPLFTVVEIPSSWKNEQSGITVYAEVHAEAIQSENLGDSAAEAFKDKTIEPQPSTEAPAA